jgi:hypothetical protein
VGGVNTRGMTTVENLHHLSSLKRVTLDMLRRFHKLEI